MPYMISFCYGCFYRVLRWLYWLKQSGPSLNAGRTNTTITYTRGRGPGNAAEACLSHCHDNLPIRRPFDTTRRSRATCSVNSAISRTLIIVVTGPTVSSSTLGLKSLLLPSSWILPLSYLNTRGSALCFWPTPIRNKSQVVALSGPQIVLPGLGGSF